MPKNLRYKIIVMVMTLVLAVVFLIPTMRDEMPQWWPESLRNTIRMGLDLQGGIHLILGVQTDKAVESSVERIASNIKTEMRKKDYIFDRVERVQDVLLQVVGLDIADRERFEAFISDQYPALEEDFQDMAGDKVTYRFGLSSDYVDHISEYAIDQGVETIRNRIDQYGVSEPVIQRQGENRILVQLPGIDDPERAIDLIGKTAFLEFKIVDDENSLEDALRGGVPSGSEIVYQRIYNPETRRTRKEAFLLKKKTLMTGDSLENAAVRISTQYNEPYISIQFNRAGAKLFDQVAAANVGKRLAIVLDNNVYSAPVIKQAHYGGSAIIEGRFTTDEARDLAIVLRAGSLPAPVEIMEKRSVGPSLGHDSIRKGRNSMIIGGVLVIAFMIAYYSMSGVVAVLALLSNLLLIIATLSLFGATLTLPGIAGLILTIGMAVDANVIIFSRIREEVRVGKTPRACIDAGYSKAFLTILDANITTLIAALVLFQFGTGPIKGFAVTLSVGIIWGVITAVFGTRVIFDYFLLRKKVTRLSI
ncbi:protein translocase subunit SecD [Thermodesulfobacteriota bacterium]